MIIALFACDGDGCNGGPSGGATRYCQEAFARIEGGPVNPAEACKSCCHQEVPYDGRIVDGKCICY